MAAHVDALLFIRCMICTTLASFTKLRTARGSTSFKDVVSNICANGGTTDIISLAKPCTCPDDAKWDALDSLNTVGKPSIPRKALGRFHGPRIARSSANSTPKSFKRGRT